VTRVAKDVLEEDLQGDRRAWQVNEVAENGKAVMVRQARTETGSGAEWVWERHAFSVAAVGTLV
jgi:hypothetical protein